MVTRNTERRARPEYSLDRIRTLAAAGRVRYVSRRVTRDVENLGYAPDDVHHCLQTLGTHHFRHAERYAETGPWLDVYHLEYRGPSGTSDPLYVKIRLDHDCVVILLHSFHRDR